MYNLFSYDYKSSSNNDDDKDEKNITVNDDSVAQQHFRRSLAELAEGGGFERRRLTIVSARNRYSSTHYSGAFDVRS